MNTPHAALVTLLTRACTLTERTIIEREGYLRAGVLVPLLLNGPLPELLFTKRTETVETHKGQISFPGGVADPLDPDITHTALRELEEELGIPAACVAPVGLLDDLATPTGFVITPVLGIMTAMPALAPNRTEVASVFTVPLEFFRKPENARSERILLGGELREVWYYDYLGHEIWGATALIVRSLLDRIVKAQEASARSDGMKRDPTL